MDYQIVITLESLAHVWMNYCIIIWITVANMCAIPINVSFATDKFYTKNS